MNRFEAIISELAAATGLGLAVDAQDSCSLITGETIITMQYRRDLDDVVIFAPLRDGDDALSLPVMQKALELGFNGAGTHGCFIGLFNGALVLSTFVPLEGMTAQSLGERILAFADVAADVEDSLEGACAGVVADDDAPKSAFASDGFLNV